MWTLGGRQFWGDVMFQGKHRIQKSAFSETCRVLNRHDYCLFRGAYANCQDFLKSLPLPEVPDTTSPSSSKDRQETGVVLLHGIIHSSKRFRLMRKSLENLGYQVFPVDYPSSQITIEQAADQLQQVLSSLHELKQVHLVGHSMGGLVIRQWFGRHANSSNHPPVGKVVMLGTPNQGSIVAERLRKFPLYRLIFGQAGQQLALSAKIPPKTFPIPTVPFGIIAGGKGEQSRGHNPLLPGDDDRTVTVESTKLPGASDFLLVRSNHSWLMKHPKTIRAVEHFLENGRFEAAHTPTEPSSPSETIPRT